jgi:hypothetical protein
MNGRGEAFVLAALNILTQAKWKDTTFRLREFTGPATIIPL